MNWLLLAQDDGGGSGYGAYIGIAMFVLYLFGKLANAFKKGQTDGEGGRDSSKPTMQLPPRPTAPPNVPPRSAPPKPMAQRPLPPRVPQPIRPVPQMGGQRAAQMQVARQIQQRAEEQARVECESENIAAQEADRAQREREHRHQAFLEAEEKSTRAARLRRERTPRAHIRRALKAPAGFRQAFLLSEVINKPVSLREDHLER